MVKVVEHLPSKCKGPELKPQYKDHKKRKERRERRERTKQALNRVEIS
jgi:hypothetical protein